MILYLLYKLIIYFNKSILYRYNFKCVFIRCDKVSFLGEMEVNKLSEDRGC
jgi:hypothetical protein